MKKQILLIGMGAFLCLGLSNQAQAHERIFYEDCEATVFDEHFLEQRYGSMHQTFWNELKSEVSQSNIAHSGSHSLVYNPYVTDNPHARTGLGSVTHGNLSGFDLHTIHSRYWYFRWYQRWESGTTYGGLNKTIYINLNPYGDFVLVLEKASSNGYHLVLKDIDTYSLVHNSWPTNSGGSLDDDTWHQIEVYLDVGTSGGNNGHFWVKVDNTMLRDVKGLSFNSTIHSNPIEHIGIPSNASGVSGSQQVWYDDIEFFTLDNPTDLPPAFSATPDTTPPTLTHTADVDANSNINHTDAILTLRNSLGLTMSGTNWKASATTGDVNCDGSSNSIDAMLILRDVRGLSMSETRWCVK